MEWWVCIWTLFFCTLNSVEFICVVKDARWVWYVMLKSSTGGLIVKLFFLISASLFCKRRIFFSLLHFFFLIFNFIGGGGYDKPSFSSLLSSLMFPKWVMEARAYKLEVCCVKNRIELTACRFLRICFSAWSHKSVRNIWLAKFLFEVHYFFHCRVWSWLCLFGNFTVLFRFSNTCLNTPTFSSFCHANCY